MKKIRRSFLLFFLLLLALGIDSCASTAPLPETLNIVPPTPDVPPEIAAFSGVWEGKWRGSLDTVLIVEKINTEKAEVIISVGHWVGYVYATANILPGPAIEWTDVNGNKFTFKMDKGLEELTGFLEEKATGAKLKAYMYRRKSK